MGIHQVYLFARQWGRENPNVVWFITEKNVKSFGITTGQGWKVIAKAVVLQWREKFLATYDFSGTANLCL